MKVHGGMEERSILSGPLFHFHVDLGQCKGAAKQAPSHDVHVHISHMGALFFL